MEEQKIIDNNVVEEVTLTDENEKPKKSKKKLIIIITAIVLTAVIALGCFFVVPSLLGEPRMKFESEEQMKEFVMGTWLESQRYDSDLEEWKNIDAYLATAEVIADNSLYEYELETMRNDMINNPDAFFKKRDLDGFLETQYKKIIPIEFDYKNSTIISGQDEVIYTVLEDGTLLDRDEKSKYHKETSNSEFPIDILTNFYNDIKSLFGVPEETVIEGVKNSYFTKGGYFSEKVGTILDELSPDYQITIENFEDVKDTIAQSSVESIENSYSDYLDRTYVATINGRFLYNPEIPNYYADYQEMMTLILVYDENDSNIYTMCSYVNRSFDQAAILVLLGGY